MQPYERIYVALEDPDISWKVVEELKGKVGGFKIGLEFMMALLALMARSDLKIATSYLREYQTLIRLIGEDLFWDIKFNDIPNTIGHAAFALSPLSPKFFDVHANAGLETIKQAVANRGASKVLAVTLLTSFSNDACIEIFCTTPSSTVLSWAKVAVEAGVDGLICSAKDLEVLNRVQKFATVPKMTPGIRPKWWTSTDDQSRVATPTEAIKLGATWIVVGRPIIKCADGYTAAADRIVEEITAAEA